MITIMITLFKKFVIMIMITGHVVIDYNQSLQLITINVTIDLIKLREFPLWVKYIKSTYFVFNTVSLLSHHYIHNSFRTKILQ